MNAWLLAAFVVVVAGIAPCLAVACRGEALGRLVAVELVSTMTVLVLLLLTRGYARSSYVDLGLVLAVLSFAGSLVFARFLERWL